MTANVFTVGKSSLLLPQPSLVHIRAVEHSGMTEKAEGRGPLGLYHSHQLPTDTRIPEPESPLRPLVPRRDFASSLLSSLTRFRHSLLTPRPGLSALAASAWVFDKTPQTCAQRTLHRDKYRHEPRVGSPSHKAQRGPGAAPPRRLPQPYWPMLLPLSRAPAPRVRPGGGIRGLPRRWCLRLALPGASFYL